MLKCPNCGYKLNSRWALVLMQIGFVALWFAWRFDPFKKHEWVADLALMVYLIGSAAFAVIYHGRAFDLKRSPGEPKGPSSTV
jgi:hypothetical protein